jgi:hypothetical protein
VAHDALVENGVNRWTVIGGAVRVTMQSRSLRNGVAHCGPFLSGANSGRRGPSYLHIALPQL